MRYQNRSRACWASDRNGDGGGGKEKFKEGFSSLQEEKEGGSSPEDSPKSGLFAGKITEVERKSLSSSKIKA